jgi:hypothetical protein
MISSYPKLIIEYDGDKQSYSYYYINSIGERMFGNKSFDFAKPFLNGKAFVKHNDSSNSYDIINETGVSIFTSLLSKVNNADNSLKRRVEVDSLFDVIKIMECCVLDDLINRHDFTITAPKFYASENLFLLRLNLFHINASVENGMKNPRFVHLNDGMLNFPAIPLQRRMSSDDDESIYHNMYFYLNLDDFKFYGPFEDANIFTEGKAAVKPFGYDYGYIDKDFVFDYEHQYQECYPFFNGLCKVKKNDKYGFVDHFNNFVLAPVYDSATSFNFGFSVVGEFISKFSKEKTIDPLVYKWDGRKSGLDYSGSFGLKLKIINLAGKPVPSEMINSTTNYISRPQINQYGEIFFNVNENDQLLFRHGNLGKYYNDKIIISHYETLAYKNPKISFSHEYNEIFFMAEIDSSYFDILNNKYIDFEMEMYEELKDAYKDAEADRYFSNPGLAFDDAEDSWNID